MREEPERRKMVTENTIKGGKDERRLVVQSGVTWPEMSSDKLRPAQIPYDSERT